MSVDAQRKVGGLSSVHGNLMRLDPIMQQYLTVRLYLNAALLKPMLPHDMTYMPRTEEVIIPQASEVVNLSQMFIHLWLLRVFIQGTDICF